jgi:hypothetical protein
VVGGKDTNLEFHLVAELPYEIDLLPLGATAVLAEGPERLPLPLVIEGTQLRVLPELTRFDDPPTRDRRISVVTGTWPNNTWLAASAASDAGPSYSDLYLWEPGRGWIKKHEYAPWVFDIVPWQDDVVLASKCESCPVAQVPGLDVRTSHGARSKRLKASACQLPDAKVPRAWIAEDALNLFGYACDARGLLPDDGNVLVMETWSRTGTKKTRRIPLPKTSATVERLLLTRSGVVAWFPTADGSPARLARFVDDAWTTIAAIPTGFVPLSAPNTSELWGVVDGNLLFWDDTDWSVTELPRDRPARGLIWTSVWRRGANDLWLVGTLPSEGAAPPRSLIFNTANGSAVGHLPTLSERDALRISDNDPTLPVTCAHPFADLLKLTPFQLGYDSTIRMSTTEARAALALALSKRPAASALTVMRHNCYGEDCIGAVVENQREADDLRKELALAVDTVLNRRKSPKTASDGPPTSWLIADSRLRCSPPPETSPFVVTR